MSAIFVHDEEQRRLAAASRDARARQIGRELHTEILPAAFYLAEDYHQKYRLRRFPELMAEFDAMYPDGGDFVASPAAARVNGYVAGWGKSQDLRTEVESLGLSPKAQQLLLKLHRTSVR